MKILYKNQEKKRKKKEFVVIVFIHCKSCLELLETIGTILSGGVGNVMLEINRLVEKLILVLENHI